MEKQQYTKMLAYPDNNLSNGLIVALNTGGRLCTFIFKSRILYIYYMYMYGVGYLESNNIAILHSLNIVWTADHTDGSLQCVNSGGFIIGLASQHT